MLAFLLLEFKKQRADVPGLLNISGVRVISGFGWLRALIRQCGYINTLFSFARRGFASRAVRG